MGDRRRVGAGVYAERVNAAAWLLEGGVPVGDAALLLSARFGVSLRQARRYADMAAAGGRIVVPEPTVVFTGGLQRSVHRLHRAGSREFGKLDHDRAGS